VWSHGSGAETRSSQMLTARASEMRTVKAPHRQQGVCRSGLDPRSVGGFRQRESRI